MWGHNICFHREIRKIIFELSSTPALICSSVGQNRFFFNFADLFSIVCIFGTSRVKTHFYLTRLLHLSVIHNVSSFFNLKIQQLLQQLKCYLVPIQFIDLLPDCERKLS